MMKEIYIPKLGQTVEEVTIVSFLVEDGAQISAGDEIMEVETDKAVFGIEADVDGFVHFGPHKLHDVVPILTVVAVIGKKDDVFTISEVDTVSSPSPQQENKVALESKKELSSQPEVTKDSDERTFISPRAKRLAEKNAIDVTFLSASGGGGKRIVEEDVVKYLEHLPDATPIAKRVASDHNIDLTKVSPAQQDGKVTKEDVEAYLQDHKGEVSAAGLLRITRDEPMRGIRKIIAEKMLASCQQTAPVTLFMDADASQMVELRKKMKVVAVDGNAMGYNEMIAKITANALKAYPAMNARIADDRIQWMQDVHMGIAVDTERGLVVPVVKNAERKSAAEISKEFKRLLEGVRNAKSAPDDLTGGTFTITNLGAYDVRAFTPIINLPESAILGLGKIEGRVVPAADGIRICKMMTLSLTFDHRLVDGAPAARFLQTIKDGIEQIKVEDLE